MVGIKFDDIVNKTFLISGKDLKLFDVIFVKHPSLQDIFDINNGVGCSELYWSMVNTLICDPYDNMVLLDDLGIDYETSDCFDVFLHHWNNCKFEYNSNKEYYEKNNLAPIDWIKKSLSFFLGDHNFDVGLFDFDLSKKDYVIYDLDSINNNFCNYAITREMFNLMSYFLLKINDIDHSNRIRPANKTAKKYLIEETRDEINRNNLHLGNKKITNDLNDYIGNMATALVFGGNGSISIFEVNKLKIYQLISGFKKTLRKENAFFIKSGIYSGTISMKSLDNNEIDWVN